MEKKTEKEEKYMKELQDRYIRFDWAIKRLLRQKANFGVLEGFLTVFLGEQIKIEEILESEGNQQDADDKFNRVDIKAKNTKGDIILIEIQNTRELYYLALWRGEGRHRASSFGAGLFRGEKDLFYQYPLF
jgi:hypothetical protein